MTHFHHVVLFRLKEGAQPDTAITVLNAARPPTGLVSWQVERSMDARKGVVLAEVAVFESVASFQAWHDSDLHASAVAHMRTVADWLVADWEA